MKCRYDLTGLMDNLKQFGIIMLMLILAACSGSSTQSPENSDGEGKVAFGIRWVDSLDRAMSAEDSEPLDCTAAGVATVHAVIYTEDGTFVTSTGAEGWDCEAHSGILTGVASGTNLRIVILGKDSQGVVKYRGEQTGITVTQGVTTTLEKVDAVEFSTELLEPDDNETVTDKLTLRWSDTIGAANYQVYISANPDLSNPDPASTDTTATSYSPTGLDTDFVYYWGVAPIDSHGNIGTVTPSRWFIVKGNLPPVLSAIGSKTIEEGETLAFAVSATDPDGDNLIYSSGNLPTGAKFNTETGQFVWTPTYYQGGKSYPNILFRVTDDGEPAYSVSETITITVGDSSVNHPPELSAIGAKTIGEDSTLQFTISATDPDTGDDEGIMYSAGNLPEGASFYPATRTFTWKPGYEQAGSYPDIYFTATDDGTPPMSDSEGITITVGDVNRPPVLDEIGNQATNERVRLRFIITGSDPDGDNIVFSAENLPEGATFTADSRVFNWTPGYDDEGIYDVTFTVTDSGTPSLQDSETIKISVGDVNRSPEISSPVGDQSVDENDTLTFTVTATDPDGDDLTYAAENLPTGATFDAGTQIFSWTPTYEQSGTYSVRFTVTDNGIPSLSESVDINIEVEDVNRPPVLTPIGDRSVNEGATLMFTVSADDPDGDHMNFSSAGLPGGASFDPTTRTFSWTPGYNDAGNYDLTFTVRDGGDPELSDSEPITITVVNQNGAPVLAAIGNRSVNENQTLTFTISATDPDNEDDLTYTAASSELPVGWTFNGNTRRFSWAPGYSAAGSYDITFTVTDDGTPTRSDFETITITVNNVNRPPVLNTIGSRSVTETNTLGFTISATDPDGDAITYSATNLPSGANLTSGGVFSWTTGYSSAGTYNVTFIATDNGTPFVLTDTEVVTITVVNVNRAPVLNAIGNRSVNEGATLNFTISATDADNDTLTYSATGLPSGATLNPTSGAFSWTTDYSDAGTYPVTFRVVDNGTPSALDDTETITISVGDVNRAPVLASIGNRSVNENATLSFTVSATDADGDDLTYTATGLPSGASLNSSSGAFSWATDYGDAGTYDVTFTVTDDGSPNRSDSEEITITVGDVNRPPVLASIGDKSVSEGATLNFTISATDPDGDGVTYSATGLPSGASIGSTSGVFSWTTDYGDAGNYDVIFRATDDGDGSLTDSETITITVGDVNRAPVLASIGDKGVNEGSSLSFSISATDPDGDDVTYSAANLPSGATLNTNSGAFSWTPDYEDAGDHEVTFIATDDGEGSLTDSETITISVVDVNRPPVLDSISTRYVSAESLLSFTVTADDPDGDNLTFSADGLPSGASFDSGTQIFTWTPTTAQIGVHSGVTFTVTDDGDPAEDDSETIAIWVLP